jgi:hypothetical protein
MMLSDDDRAFIARRSRFVRTWPLAGGFLVIALGALVVWLWITRPLMTNPFALARALEAGALPESTLYLLTAMLPVMTLACFGVVGALLVFAFVTFARESRYLRIVESAADLS